MSAGEHLNEIKFFVMAAELGSFTAAARRLGATKSGIAKSVSRLEARLGVRLINRTTRQFTLTAEGQSYHENCSRILAELEEAETELAAHSARPRGKLRIDMPVVFGRQWAMPALIDIGCRFPELALDVTLNDHRIDLIKDGVDLAIRIGELDDSTTLVSKSLGTQQAVVCASPEYIAKHGSPSTLADLDKHECIAYSPKGEAEPWVFLDKKGKPLAHRISGRFAYNNCDAVCATAIGGQGIAHLCNWLVADHLREGRLVRVLPNIATCGFPIHAVWPGSRQKSAKVRVVVDELARHFLPTPPWNRIDEPACQHSPEPCSRAS